MKDLKKFIIPIVDESPKACGFLIPNYFITAGHVFDNSDSIKIFFDGDYYSFHKSEAVYLRTPKESANSEDAQDVAIFKFHSIDSPLSLCGPMPQVIPPIKCYSLIPVTGQNPYILQITECQIKRTLYNFIECSSNLSLKEGTSGSPLIADNIVYGILSGCMDPLNNPETILFCSTKKLPIK